MVLFSRYAEGPYSMEFIWTGIAFPDSTLAEIFQCSDAEIIRRRQGCYWYVKCLCLRVQLELMSPFARVAKGGCVPHGFGVLDQCCTEGGLRYPDALSESSPPTTCQLLTMFPSSCLFSYVDLTSLIHQFVHTLLTRYQTISTLRPRIRTLSRCMRRLSFLPCSKTACIQRCRILCVVHAFTLSTRRTYWPKRVRAAALKYLSLLPGTVRYDVLHPYKASVLKELAKALDDPKRAVRKEAVNARYDL